MFVVFEAKGFQYCGSPGDKLKIPRLNTKVGEKVSFEKVLLVKNEDIKIGKPYIEGASIKAKVLEHARYKKILVFKFKRRKRYKRTRGHRQTYTEIEIKDIILGGKAKTKKKEEKKEVKVEKKTTIKSKTKQTVKKTTKEKAKKIAGKAKKSEIAAVKAKKVTKKTTSGKVKETTAKKKKTSKSSGKTTKKSGTTKKTGKKKTAGKKTTGKEKKETKK